MKRDTKIFITCLVVGMWILNLGMVNLSKASHSNNYYMMAVGVIGMIGGSLLLTYPLKEKEDGTD